MVKNKIAAGGYMTEIKKKDIMICGFALFAIFVGAGNLIFPPYLGVVAKSKWVEVMLGFLLSDPVLPILGVIVTVMLGGKAEALGKRVNPVFAAALGLLIILTIGPLYAIPRTGATTYEIFIQPLQPVGLSHGTQRIIKIVTCFIFFALTLYFVLNEGKVIEIIGKYLTPGLLIVLAVVVIVSIVKPPGQIVHSEDSGMFVRGLKEGYQTMDAMVSALFAGIVSADLARRGYKDKKTQIKASIQVGIVSFVLLALVYGSLTYAGATVSSYYTPENDRTEILIGMVNMMLGTTGKVLMGIVVTLACLTTSVGLVSVCGNYFQSLSKGALEYKAVAVVTTIISFILSLLGVTKMIEYSGPILSCVYPMIIALILVSFFDKYIKYNLTYARVVTGAFIVGFVQNAPIKSAGFEGFKSFINSLPLHSIGFEWVVPTLVFGIIFTIIATATGIGGTLEDFLKQEEALQKASK